MGPQQRRGDTVSRFTVILGIHKYDFVVDIGWLEVSGADQLQCKHVLAQIAQHAQPGLEPGCIQKVRDYDDQALGTRHCKVALERGLEAGVAAALELYQELKCWPSLILATQS